MGKLFGKYNIIKVKPYVLKDYAGLNFHASKTFGFKDYPIKRDEILVDERLSPSHIEKTAIHEIIEDENMKRGDSYFEAHKKALLAEDKYFDPKEEFSASAFCRTGNKGLWVAHLGALKHEV